MRKSFHLICILTLFSSVSVLAQGLSEEDKAEVRETAKKELAKLAKTQVFKETKNKELSNAAGDAVITVFNHFEERAELRKQVLNEIANANSGLIHLRFNGHTDKINRLKFTPDSERVITGSEDGTLIIRSLTDGSVIKKIDFSEEVMDIKFNQNGKLMAIATAEQIHIYDFENVEELEVIERGSAGKSAAKTASVMYFHPTNPTQIIYFEPELNFYVYDFVEGEVISEIKVEGRSNLAKGAMYISSPTAVKALVTGFQDLKAWIPAPDGKSIIVQTIKKTYSWDLEKDEEILVYQKNKGAKKYVGIPIGFMGKNNDLVTLSDDEIIIYEWQSGQQLEQAYIPIATTVGQAYEDKIIFSPDQEFFLIAGSQNIDGQDIVSLDVYKTKSLTKMLSFPSALQDSREFYHYDWTANGKYIVKYCSSCKDEGVLVYDVEEKPQPEEVASQSEPTQSMDKYAELKKLKELLDEGILTQKEFDEQKAKILNKDN